MYIEREMGTERASSSGERGGGAGLNQIAELFNECPKAGNVSQSNQCAPRQCRSPISYPVLCHERVRARLVAIITLVLAKMGV